MAIGVDRDGAVGLDPDAIQRKRPGVGRQAAHGQPDPGRSRRPCGSGLCLSQQRDGEGEGQFELLPGVRQGAAVLKRRWIAEARRVVDLPVGPREVQQRMGLLRADRSGQQDTNDAQQCHRNDEHHVGEEGRGTVGQGEFGWAAFRTDANEM